MGIHCIDVLRRFLLRCLLVAATACAATLQPWTWLEGPVIARVGNGIVAQSSDDQTETQENEIGDEEDSGPLPEVFYDDAVLPEAVLKTRNALLLAARSGDIEQLRPILQASEVKTLVSFGDETDPIAYWKSSSFDGSGRDILAEMIKIFSSGFVYIHPGTPDALYVWPYHFVYPLDKLTAEQEVELYLLIPPQYRDDMEAAGGYIGFRAGIDPNGSLVFFVAGD